MHITVPSNRAVGNAGLQGSNRGGIRAMKLRAPSCVRWTVKVQRQQPWMRGIDEAIGAIGIRRAQVSRCVKRSREVDVKVLDEQLL